jgi:hypothetical protein
MYSVAANSDRHGEHGGYENSGSIAAATSATGIVSHHGWLLVIRALKHGHARPRRQPIQSSNAAISRCVQMRSVMPAAIAGVV